MRGSKKTKNRLDEIRKMGQRRYLEGLVVALEDENDLIRLEAVEWLYRICDEGTIEPLIGALKDTNSKIREYAILALIFIGGDEVFEPLINALDDTSDRIRNYAAEALGEIGDKRALVPLEELLSKGYNKTAREAIIKIKFGIRKDY